MAVKGISKSNTNWKNNLKRLIQNNNYTQTEFSFISIDSGKHVDLGECLYDELLPVEIKASPISSLAKDDNLWIATSMLARVAESSNEIVVLENDFPVGTIGVKEILKGVLKNPDFDFFDKTISSDVMNRNFYMDTRKAQLAKIIHQMTQTKRQFAIIQNRKSDYSGISVKEILEIGALCKTSITAAQEKLKKTSFCTRETSVRDIIKGLIQDDADYLLLNDENLVLDSFSIIERITTDFNFLRNVENFLDLNLSIFQFRTPKLIPERLEFSEICKLMLEMKYPYLTTSTRLWTPLDVLDCLKDGIYE